MARFLRRDGIPGSASAGLAQRRDEKWHPSLRSPPRRQRRKREQKQTVSYSLLTGTPRGIGRLCGRRVAARPEKIAQTHVGRNDDVISANHHLFPALFAEFHRSRRIRILGIVRRVVK